MKKPVNLKKLTLKKAIEESIKMWHFLSENGKRDKTDYFGYGEDDTDINSPLSGCYLCEYIFHIAGKEDDRFRNFKASKLCEKYDCPLKDDELCCFAHPFSAFSDWLELSPIEIEDDIKLREEAARKILDALQESYKKLTGEEFKRKKV